MRTIFFLFLIHIFAVTAFAQSKPYHVFEYDVPKAHFVKDDATISNRLFNNGSATGDLMIVECTAHKKYNSTITFMFANENNNAMFSLRCFATTGVMNSSYLLRKKISSAKLDYVEHIDRLLQARVGTRVPVSVQLYDNTVTFTIGGQSLVKKLDFDVKNIELLGVGSNGIARFFDDGLIG